MLSTQTLLVRVWIWNTTTVNFAGNRVAVTPSARLLNGLSHDNLSLAQFIELGVIIIIYPGIVGYLQQVCCQIDVSLFAKCYPGAKREFTYLNS